MTDINQDPEKFVEEQAKSRFEFGDDTNEYFVPSREELDALNADFFRELTQARRDHGAFYERLRQNELAYEALPEVMAGNQTMLVLPLVRRDCDAIVAWFVNEVMKPHPIMSIDPCFPADYQVPVEDPTMGRAMIPVTAEQVAKSLEHAVEYILRERIKFRQLVETVIGETVRGRGPAIVKVVFDRKFHEQFVRDVQEGALGIPMMGQPKKVRKEDGDPIKVYAIPTEHFMMPSDAEHPLTARWCSELMPLSTSEMRRELERKHALIKKEDWGTILESTGEVEVPGAVKEMKQRVDGRAPMVPLNRHHVVEVWFEHYYKDEAGKTQPVKLMGWYHMTAGRFVWIIRNPYFHQRNPYVAFFQKKRPFRFSGSSTAEEVAVIQKLASQMLHLAIQSAVTESQSILAMDPDSDAFDILGDAEIEPGMTVPISPEQIKAIPLGAQARSLMPETEWLMQFERTISGQSTYDEGSYIPGRTSPNSIDMIMKSGQQIPLSQLQGYADGFCEVIWLYLKTYKQFRPYGEILYLQGPERDLVEIAFRLPDEEALDNFKVTLTAADQLASQEASSDKLVMLAGLLDVDADKLAAILGPFADMGMPDSIAAILERVISRKQEVLELLFEQLRTDSKNFTIPKEMLEAVAQEKMMMRQQQMMMAQQQPMAGPPGAPPPEMMGGGMPQ